MDDSYMAPHSHGNANMITVMCSHQQSDVYTTYSQAMFMKVCITMGLLPFVALWKVLYNYTDLRSSKLNSHIVLRTQQTLAANLLFKTTFMPNVSVTDL